MSAVNVDMTNLATALSLAGGEKVNYGISAVLRSAAAEIQRQAQEKAPKRTGALASSIVVNFNGPLSVIIGPTVPYGVFQEFGTRGPYTIVPRKPDGYLVFEINGQKIFTKKVTHPGLKAHPYMRPAAEQVIGKLRDAVGGVGVSMVVQGDTSP